MVIIYEYNNILTSSCSSNGEKSAIGLQYGFTSSLMAWTNGEPLVFFNNAPSNSSFATESTGISNTVTSSSLQDQTLGCYFMSDQGVWQAEDCYVPINAGFICQKHPHS